MPHHARIPSRHLPSVVTGLAVLALVAGACASSGAEASTSVASLGETPAADVSDATSADTDDLATAEDAALAFSACMRDEGLDFPDIGVDANGNPDIRDAFESAGLNPGNDEFRSAMETCGELLAGAGFGGGRGAGGDDTELQDAFVAFSECLRDEGLDVGDFQPGGGGAGGGGEDGPQRGQGGGSGNPGDRLAQALGIDPDDPQVAAALEVCQPMLTDALGDRPGGGTPPD